MRFSLSAGLVMAALVFCAAPQQASAQTDAQLRSIGSLGASHIYTTYGYIGVLADAYVKDVYAADKVQELMNEVVGIVSANIKNLEDVKKDGLSEADAASVEEMITIYKMLQTQATTLSEFTKNKDREKAVEFEKVRKDVWPKIARLLGIDGK